MIAQLLRQARRAALGVAGLRPLARRIGASRWRSSRLLILCYHGIAQADEHEWSDLYVTRDHLAARLTLLARLGANVLPLPEAVVRLAEGTLPPMAVALTFDDGAVDFARQAVPVLQAAGMPATVYLTTWYCDRPWPVFDTTLAYLLWRGRGRQIALSVMPSAVTIPNHHEHAQFQALHEHLRSRATAGLSAEERNAVLAELAAAVHVDFDAFLEQRLLQLMNRHELHSLDPALVDVQLHTHRHRTPLLRDEFLREIRDNRTAIATLTGRTSPLQHFCYPSGDHRPAFGRWLVEAGIRSATTCDPGLASPEHDPLFLPRIIDTMAMPAEVFAGWVVGTAHFVHRRRPAIVRARH